MRNIFIILILLSILISCGKSENVSCVKYYKSCNVYNFPGLLGEFTKEEATSPEWPYLYIIAYYNASGELYRTESYLNQSQTNKIEYYYHDNGELYKEIVTYKSGKRKTYIHDQSGQFINQIEEELTSDAF